MTREVALTQGKVTIVDAADYDAVMAAGPWYAQQSGRTWYARRSIGWGDDYTKQMLHSFLTGYPMADHRDLDGLNNRRSNLRPASSVENRRNMRRHRDNTSGFKGVTRTGSRWRARIKVNDRRLCLGTFDTAEEAARAYDAAAVASYADFAALNFPPEAVAS